ncbi:glutathione S-transferase family protein [Ramaria rubella]|nr:glutathione S-transferase family protein [Ramaria rubella]
MAPKVTLFAHGLAVNPIKVAILLEELDVEYDIIHKELGDVPKGVKAPDFLKLNPNGRLPVLIDHTNNDHIVWESGAIILYLAERFDPSNKFIGVGLEERSQVWEWLFFQMSGLGPSQGQAVWFLRYHPLKEPEIHPSVMERYRDETYRIYGVFEKKLEGEWIVLGRFTLADVASYPWIHAAEFCGLSLAEFPRLAAYHERIQALPSVKRAYARLFESRGA